jgi:hypothetical protein
MSVKDRLMHAWNAFAGQDSNIRSSDYGAAYSTRPDRVRMFITNERSIISSIYTRLAIDVASVPIRHIRLDTAGRYSDDIQSGLQNCLTLEANLDQAPRAFRQDLVMTLFDKGVAAVVPVDTSITPTNPGSFDILSMRVGEIVQWYPAHIRVSLYNEQTGRREEITVEKRFAAIVENPLYSVMNEPNSTLQRLLRKLNLLDAVDEQASSGKLDLIIQLPYVVKSEARRQQANQRRTDIETQLKDGKYGIAYTDGTEKITQLNRPVENNLLAQIQYLTEMLYSQLGLTPEVMNGTADEKTMLNYTNRAIDPVLTSIVEAMRRSFLTKTARTQGQSIDYFRDPFKLMPLSNIADVADKLTRNEITSSNEIRQFIGLRPSTDPRADQLRNSNMPQSELGMASDPTQDPNYDPTQDPFSAQYNPALDPNSAPLQVASTRATPTQAIQ